MRVIRTCAPVIVCSLFLSALLTADTLVLRDGRRVEGELIAMQNGVVEFQTRGPFGPERARINRSDIARIEFESMDRDVREEREQAYFPVTNGDEAVNGHAAGNFYVRIHGSPGGGSSIDSNDRS